VSDLKTLLTGIYQDRGRLDGETVVHVTQSAGPAHPLYTYFEWDDAVAGHQYRVQQANKLIRTVKIETRSPTINDGPHFVRAFVSNRQAGTGERNSGYSPIENVVQDDVSYQMLLRAFKRQVAELERRYGHLVEYREIMRKAGGEGDPNAA